MTAMRREYGYGGGYAPAYYGGYYGGGYGGGTRRLTMAADTGPTTAGRMSAACIVPAYAYYPRPRYYGGYWNRW